MHAAHLRSYTNGAIQVRRYEHRRRAAPIAWVIRALSEMAKTYNPLETPEKRTARLVSDFNILKCMVKNVTHFTMCPAYPQ